HRPATAVSHRGPPLEEGRTASIVASGLPAPATYLIRATAEGNPRGESFPGTSPPPFSGFFPPLGDENLQNAGSTIPVKFSVGLDLGLDIFAPGSLFSRQINCSPNSCGANVGIGPWEPTDSVGGVLRTTDGQYHYDWNTDK